FPLKPKYTFWERVQNRFTMDVSRRRLLAQALDVIAKFKPDVIHVFGSEWCYGQVVEFIDTPVVIHMQGSIPPYNNAFYPPGYSRWDEVIINLKKFKYKNVLKLPAVWNKRNSWKKQEERTLGLVKNYMGRTNWDRSIVNSYQPDALYFYCNEALRPSFINSTLYWKPTDRQKIRLITVGCSCLWKGLDTIVRTAKMLIKRDVDFEWYLVGKIANKELIEWKESVKMENIKIKILGMIGTESLIKHLCDSDIYIHTAYIDNSPNSICEAQYLGLPIIATYVGGIPSLIENQVDGSLIPANDPFSLSDEIIKLSKSNERKLIYSENSKKKAKSRHNPDNILNDLISIYNRLETN